jgi:hypothetical protein
MTKEELDTLDKIIVQLQGINGCISEMNDLYLSQAGELQVMTWKLQEIVKNNSTGEEHG